MAVFPENEVLGNFNLSDQNLPKWTQATKVFRQRYARA